MYVDRNMVKEALVQPIPHFKTAEVVSRKCLQQQQWQHRATAPGCLISQAASIGAASWNSLVSRPDGAIRHAIICVENKRGLLSMK